VATVARSAAFTSTSCCPIASLGSLPLWCSVTVISLQVAGALSSGLSYCIRSLPLILELARVGRVCVRDRGECAEHRSGGEGVAH